MHMMSSEVGLSMFVWALLWTVCAPQQGTEKLPGMLSTLYLYSISQNEDFI